MAPLLDEALLQMAATDRHALLLRYAEQKNHREVGRALGLGEEAAKKRVARALEKLRTLLGRKGLVVTIAALGSALSHLVTQAAPSDMVAQVVAQSLASPAMPVSASATLAQQTLDAWSWLRLKWLGAALVGGVVLMLGLGALMEMTKHTPAITPSAVAAADIVPSGAMETPTQARVAMVSANNPIRNPGSALQLKVVEKQTGEPVTNVSLAVNIVSQGTWNQRYDLKTDATGWAVIPYPADAGRLDVGVLANGWNARFATWRADREGALPEVYTLKVSRVAQSMGGYVRNSSGQPVAGAEIVMDFEGTGDADFRETPRERPGFEMSSVVARTGPDGRWSCAVVDPRDNGGYYLMARHPDYASESIAGTSARKVEESLQQPAMQELWAGQLVTILPSGWTLQGRVVDDAGQPVANALVAHDPYATSAIERRTDGMGRFAFTKLEAESFDFSVSAAGFAPEYRNLNPAEQTGEVVVQLHPGARLVLRLQDDAGQPVTGARVGMEQWGEVRHKLRWEALSDDDGYVIWDSAPLDETLEIFAVKSGWCYTRSIRVVADATEHTILMQRVLEVEGEVVEAESGRPLAEFSVFPGCGETWLRSETQHRMDGRFRLSFTEKQFPWRVRVEAVGCEPFESESISTDYTGLMHIEMRRTNAPAMTRSISR